MKKIKIQNKYAIVDNEDFDRLNQYRWRLDKDGYAKTTTLKFMHRLVLNLQPNDGKRTDHKNRNRLDNRKENLRIATIAQNNQNCGKKPNNTSGYKGISWHKHHNKWISNIRYNGKRIHLGYFSNKEDAAATYKNAAIKYHGEFVCLD